MEAQVLDPRELVLNASELGSPPVVYRRLMEVVEDPHSGAAEVADVISQDPSLTARLLRLVNSAFFALSRQVDTVGHAVNLVGMTQVRDLALATSVTSIFRDVPPDMIHQEDFWRHSLACGISARAIARARGEANIERYFVAGMLHDVGRLVLYLNAPEIARKILDQAEEQAVPLYEVEREMTGIDHGEIGAALMAEWNLPEVLAEAVAFHHRPTEATEHKVESATIHVADAVAHKLELGRSGERTPPEVSIDALEILGLTEEDLAEIEEVTAGQYKEAVQAFGLSDD